MTEFIISPMEESLIKERNNIIYPLRCGEVMLLDDESFWFTCAFCDERFPNYSTDIFEHLRDHIADKYVPTTSNDPLHLEIDDLKEEVSDGDNDDQNHSQSSQEHPTELKEITNCSSPENNSKHIKANQNPEQCKPIDTSSEQKKIPKKRNRKKKSYTCKICEKEVFGHSSFQQHMRTHSEYSPYQCEECGKFFKASNNLKAHLIVHSGTRPYKCDVCGTGFSHKNTLKYHRYLHTGERPYECEYCHKTFPTSCAHKDHIKRNHTGIRPHSCNLCTQKFYTKASLKHHMLKHDGVRPFSCEECGKSYFDKWTRDKHMLSHSDKKVACDICPAKFTYKKNLVEHKKLHKDVKEYVCIICGKEFAQNAGLYSHMKSHKDKNTE